MNKYSEERKILQEKGLVPDWWNTAGYQLFVEKYQWANTPLLQYRKIAQTAARHVEDVWPEAESKFFELLWKGWLSPSTPILANMGAEHGLPVSCSGNYVDDSIDGFYTARRETAILTKHGFGTSSYLGDVRPRGTPYKGGKASGVQPLYNGFTRDMFEVAQASARRGAWAGYISIEHGDFDEIADLLLTSPDGLNVGWNVHDGFINKLNNGDIEALRRYQKALKVKMITGKGYFFFVDKANRARPQTYKDLGLDIKASNLCTEIMLHSSEEYTFTCQPSIAPIISTKGLVTLGDVNIGSVIWSKEGWTKIVNKVSTGIKSVYEYRTSSGSFIGTEDHRIVADGIKVEVDKAESVDSCPTESPYKVPGSCDDWGKNYIVLNGLMLGDGTLRNGRPQLCVGENDTDYYDQLSNVLYYDGYKQFRDIKVPIIIDVSTRTFNRDFDPKDFKGVENYFLKGLFSANGSVVKQKDGCCPITLTQTSKNVANKVMWMLQYLGYSPRIYKTTGVETEWSNGVYVSKDRYDVKLLKIKDVIRFREEIGFLQRYKQDILDTVEDVNSKHRVISNPILEKIYLGEMEVFHIEVDNISHTYWTGGLDVSNCVLSSMNIAKYDEWAGTYAVYWATIFLDCVAEEFIQKAKSIPGLEKAAAFTEKGRALGLGQCGLHTFLQSRRIPMESLEAVWISNVIAHYIMHGATMASADMASRLGVPEWCKDTGRRNTHLIAIAPTKSTALIMGGISEGINPDPAMVYTQTTAAGELLRINPVLLELMKERGVYDNEHIQEIEDAFGSVQGVDWLTDTEKQVFKTAFEMDQHALVRLSAARQQYVDQGQSLNLFFSADTAEEYISEVHKRAFENENILSLYYCYSKAGVKASEKGECIACQ